MLALWRAMMLWLLLHYQRILRLSRVTSIAPGNGCPHEARHCHHQAVQARRGPRRSHQNWRSGADRHRGTGLRASKGHTEIYRGVEYAERFLPKIKIGIACLSNKVDKVIEAIISSAKSEKIGDGKIFVYGLDHVVRIRTGETDTDAI